MAKAEETSPTSGPSISEKEVAIDQAIDVWLTEVANAGEPWALRRAAEHATRLKQTIHTILEEI
jgi:hypothetical protein